MGPIKGPKQALVRFDDALEGAEEVFARACLTAWRLGELLRCLGLTGKLRGELPRLDLAGGLHGPAQGDLDVEERRREAPRKLLELCGELGRQLLLDRAGILLMENVEREGLGWSLRREGSSVAERRQENTTVMRVMLAVVGKGEE